VIITSVTYRKLVTGPSFSNQAVEATAQVLDGDSPEDVLLQLSQWVKSQLGEGSAVMNDPETLRLEVNHLHNQRQQLRGAIAGAEAELRKVRDDIVALEVKREKAGGEPCMPF
jgi:hypothetical protein